MTRELLSFVISFGQTFLKAIPISLALGAVFTILTWFWACNPGRAWWHKRDLVTDLCYWFFIPIIARYLRIGMLIVGAALLFRITTTRRADRFLRQRSRPAGGAAACRRRWSFF